MNWFKKYSENDFVSKIRKILKAHPFTNALCEYYNIPISEIDTDLKIEITDLGGKFAEGNGKVIRIDKKLLDTNFFNKNFHFVIHEFFHWLKRRSEDKFYFNDPEEIQGFVLQMTWEALMGKNKEEIIEKMYPIISTHFKNNKYKLNLVFHEMINKAFQLASVYTSEKTFSMI